jgi:predicted dehydrogenase
MAVILQPKPALSATIGLFLTIMSFQPLRGAEGSVHLITLDPRHFHAALVQKFMYPQVSPIVVVFSPGGADLQEHLKRIESFNSRSDKPTHWEEKVYTGPDFLERMRQEPAGGVVVISGNNARKTEYIDQSIKAGMNVLADKPMAIDPRNFELLRQVFSTADQKKVLLFDIMTERYEMVSILQRELARDADLFGSLEKGSSEQPAVEMQSVHHFYKQVAGKPLIRPAWSFDTRQQGEAIPDVGTHLVDLVQWICFPDQSLDWRKDVKVLEAHRWVTKLTPEQFKQCTGLEHYPEFLKESVSPEGSLNIYANGDVGYTLRGVHMKVTALWNFEAPQGAGDLYSSTLRGTRATLTTRQGANENYVPTLYVESKDSTPSPEFQHALKAAIGRISGTYPGVEVKTVGANTWQVIVPDKYNLGHESHFAQVAEKFLKCLAQGKLPKWEAPNMLAKYYTTTEAYRLSHGSQNGNSH